ncbi:hypothetical protein WGA_03953 [Escherichia coli KTE40]|nr:hypothetical protein WGA_03953 [Escherichia coli KTE40]
MMTLEVRMWTHTIWGWMIQWNIYWPSITVLPLLNGQRHTQIRLDKIGRHIRRRSIHPVNTLQHRGTTRCFILRRLPSGLLI